MLYVFVDIKVDLDHFIKTVKHNFKDGSKIAMVSTVQFLSTLQVKSLRSTYFLLNSNCS